MRSLLICFCLLAIAAKAQQRPNIIYIMSDDHDNDAISAYNNSLLYTPNIDRLAKEGMIFKRAFVGNSICGPARATLLTGQHSHNNGVKTNRNRFDSSRITLPLLLRVAGYQTAVIGKWHLHSYPAGFDYWKILPGQGLYFDPRLIHMSGDTVTYKGFATDVITAEALSWLQQKRDTAKPFMMLLHHKAPHRYFFPPLKYIEQFHTKTYPEPPTLYIPMEGHGTAWQRQTMSILLDMKLSSDLKVDPVYLMNIPELKPDSAEIAYYNGIMRRIPEADRKRIKEIYAERGKLIREKRPTGNDLLQLKYQWYMQDYLACVASIDENVGKVLNYLDSSGLAQNTLVIYTSDQGMYLGENGWFDKRWMYDVSAQVPLLVRWPGKIKPGTISNALVQNIDYAPTFLEVGGEEIPKTMDGVSLKQILLNNTPLKRDELYYHFYEYNADHTVLQHLGIRGDRYKLIYFYTVGEWELYDLLSDPGEQKNLINEPAYKPVIKKMKKHLVALRKKYDDKEPAGELK